MSIRDLPVLRRFTEARFKFLNVNRRFSKGTGEKV